MQKNDPNREELTIPGGYTAEPTGEAIAEDAVAFDWDVSISADFDAGTGVGMEGVAGGIGADGGGAG